MTSIRALRWCSQHYTKGNSIQLVVHYFLVLVCLRTSFIFFSLGGWPDRNPVTSNLRTYIIAAWSLVLHYWRTRTKGNPIRSASPDLVVRCTRRTQLCRDGFRSHIWGKPRSRKRQVRQHSFYNIEDVLLCCRLLNRRINKINFPFCKYMSLKNEVRSAALSSWSDGNSIVHHRIKLL